MVFPSGKAFVEAVMVRLNAHGPTALVRRMEWQNDINKASLISKWTTGVTEPSYGPTMEMLEKCGWLTSLDLTPIKEAEGATAAEAAKQELGRQVAEALEPISAPQALPQEQPRTRRRKTG